MTAIPTPDTLSRRLSRSTAVTPALARLRAAAVEAGADLWLVGGPVRDAALGRDFLDIDATCTSRLDRLRAAISGPSGSRGFRFAKRGVTTWRLSVEGRSVDIVDASRRGLDADLARRDFTINAMAWNIVSGDVVDPLGGLRDLERGALRLAARGVIVADPVRALRAARFLATFPTFELSRPAATEARGVARALGRASVERLRDELDKLLLAPEPDRGLATLARLDLADSVMPELAGLRSCVAGRDRPDVWRHTLETLRVSSHARRRRLPAAEVLDDMESLRVLRWSLLLHDISKPETLVIRPDDGKPTFHGHDVLGADRAGAVLHRLRLPKRTRQRVMRLVRLHLRPGHLGDNGASGRAVRRLVAAAGEDLPLLVLHSACDALGSGTDDPPRWRSLRGVFTILLEAWSRDRRVVTPLIDGSDVMNVCALEPGPDIGRILGRVRSLQVAGKLTTREAALDWLKGQRLSDRDNGS